MVTQLPPRSGTWCLNRKPVAPSTWWPYLDGNRYNRVKEDDDVKYRQLDLVVPSILAVLGVLRTFAAYFKQAHNDSRVHSHN